jgi:hypothetical protein
MGQRTEWLIPSAFRPFFMTINNEIHVTGDQMDILRDLWNFMRVRKKFWLLPIIMIMLTLGGLIVFSGGSALAPFIYTLF